ncbi:MAG: nucleotidyltransferase domain-containing protein [Pyrobaculum sp.]
MECREVVPGVLELVRCLGGRLGSFSALLTGSRARGEARGALSDLDLIIFAEADRGAAVCCWGLPYECDLIFVKPEDVGKLLEAGFLALIEGLWHGVYPLSLLMPGRPRGASGPVVIAPLAPGRPSPGRAYAWRGGAGAAARLATVTP